MTVAEASAALGMRSADLRAAVDSLIAEKRIVVAGAAPPTVLALAVFQQVAKATLDTVEQFHRGNPLVPGIATEELRTRTAKALGVKADALAPAVLRAVLEQLVHDQRVEVTGELVKQAGHQVALSSDEQQLRERIEAAFKNAGFRAPAVHEVLSGTKVDATRAQKILHLLVREQVLVKITDELIFHRAALEELRTLLAAQKRRSPRISVPAFKELTGVSRKYAIPMLEYLDRTRVTRRVGDEREIL
jgi:selenocysteine-specific elongation factor